MSRLLSFDNLSDQEQHALVRSNCNKLIGYLWALYCQPTDLMGFAQGTIQYNLFGLVFLILNLSIS